MRLTQDPSLLKYLLSASLVLGACQDCPKGITKIYKPDKTWRCVDVDAEVRSQMAAEEALSREKQRREAAEEDKRRLEDRKQADVDARIRAKAEHNFKCGKPGAGCDLEPLTEEEARQASQWRVRERLRLRPRAMRGETLSEFEQNLLKD